MGHEAAQEFAPLRDEGRRYFIWNSAEWWKWFTAYRRKPSIKAIQKHLSEYEFFIAYHGTRSADIESYYTFGLRSADYEELNRKAKTMLTTSEYPQITDALFEAAVAKASKLHDKNLFLLIDYRELSGHYMIYGSEYICGIAATMTRAVEIDCRQLLKRFGIPTLLRIALPREMIPEEQLYDFAGHIREYIWDERKRSAPPQIDWSFQIQDGIPGERLIDHVHPERIEDPHFQNYPYTYKNNFPCFP
jgi:hypothetical protein